MPTVNGRVGARPVSAPSTAPESSAPAGAPPPSTEPAGWTPGGSQSRPQVNTAVAPPSVSAADVQATLPNPVRQALQKSVDSYTARVETTLNHDAMAIAEGKTPVREGDPLSAAQVTQLQSATTDFIKDVPLGALSPELAASVQQKLKDAGIEVRDLASTRLGDLGKVGGDIAKDLVKDLKTSSPTAYYSLAGGLAAAIGYTAWNDGSAKLSRLGIKPEVKQSFFDGALNVKLSGDWQAHFKNFKGTATVGTQVSLGSAGKVTAQVTADTKNGFDNATVGYALDRPNWNLSANADFDKNGFEHASVGGGYHDGELAVSGAVTASAKGLESASGRVAWNPNPDFRLSAAVDHNFQTDRTTASAQADWKVRQNVDFALSASHDSAGDSRVGVGVTIHF
jgi:hypothetical protein